jgi:hypothetical protein
LVSAISGVPSMTSTTASLTCMATCGISQRKGERSQWPRDWKENIDTLSDAPAIHMGILPKQYVDGVPMNARDW